MPVKSARSGVAAREERKLRVASKTSKDVAEIVEEGGPTKRSL